MKFLIHEYNIFIFILVKTFFYLCNQFQRSGPYMIFMIPIEKPNALFTVSCTQSLSFLPLSSISYFTSTSALYNEVFFN